MTHQEQSQVTGGWASSPKGQKPGPTRTLEEAIPPQRKAPALRWRMHTPLTLSKSLAASPGSSRPDPSAPG